MSRLPTIDDFPPRYREQIRQQLAAASVPACVPGGSPGAAPTREPVAEKPVSGMVGRRLSSSAGDRRRQPNKNESAFNRIVLGGRGLFEPLTIRLPGGSRYTPDFVTFEKDADGTLRSVHLYEVKGSYRLGSHGRALTAWREARAAFPEFSFHWFEQVKTESGRTWKEKHA